MENNRGGKSRRAKKQSKPLSWKILNELHYNSDFDSDGTTGSIGADRERDSSECSSTTNDSKKMTVPQISSIYEDPPVIQNSQKKSKEGKSIKKGKPIDKKRNYNHKNNDAMSSFLNSMLVGVLLIVSGLASGHYYGSHQRNGGGARMTPAVLNKYVSKTLESYKKLVTENSLLRDRLQTLEETLGIATECRKGLNNNHFEDEMILDLKGIFNDELNLKALDMDTDSGFKLITTDSGSQTDPAVVNTTTDTQPSNESDVNFLLVQNNVNDNSDNDNQISYITTQEELINAMKDGDFVVVNCDAVDKGLNGEQEGTGNRKMNKNGAVYNLRKIFDPILEDELNQDNDSQDESTDEDNWNICEKVECSTETEPLMYQKYDDHNDLDPDDTKNYGAHREDYYTPIDNFEINNEFKSTETSESDKSQAPERYDQIMSCQNGENYNKNASPPIEKTNNYHKRFEDAEEKDVVAYDVDSIDYGYEDGSDNFQDLTYEEYDDKPFIEDPYVDICHNFFNDTKADAHDARRKPKIRENEGGRSSYRKRLKH